MKKSIFGVALGLLVAAQIVHADFSFTKNLYFGIQNSSEVKELQNFLTKENLYSGPVTGNFFSLTLKAVTDFQAREHIEPTQGYVGPKTRERINQLLLSAQNPGESVNLSLQDQISALLAKIAELQKQIPVSAPIVAEKTIDPRSIVGLLCYFKAQSTGHIVILDKGSGVVFDPRGYILTARHLIESQTTQSPENGAVDNFIFDHCGVALVPAHSTLPTPDAIRTINPVLQLPGFQYVATLDYVPSATLGLSALELEQLDFAVLKITGVSDSGEVSSLSPSFDYAELLDGIPKIGDGVITYGFPGDVSVGRMAGFTTLFLGGSVGQVKAIDGGDAYFKNKPLVLETMMEVRGGRSGSALFWKGRIAGIVFAHAENNITDSFSVSSSAISEVLKARGF